MSEQFLFYMRLTKLKIFNGKIFMTLLFLVQVTCSFILHILKSIRFSNLSVSLFTFRGMHCSDGLARFFFARFILRLEISYPSEAIIFKNFPRVLPFWPYQDIFH